MGRKMGKLYDSDLKHPKAIIAVVNTPRLEGIPRWAAHDITLKIGSEYCDTEFYESAKEALERTLELLKQYPNLRLSRKSSKSFLLKLSHHLEEFKPAPGSNGLEPEIGG